MLIPPLDRFSEHRDTFLNPKDWDEIERAEDDYADWLASRDEDNKALPIRPEEFEKSNER